MGVPPTEFCSELWISWLMLRPWLLEPISFLSDCRLHIRCVAGSADSCAHAASAAASRLPMWWAPGPGMPGPKSPCAAAADSEESNSHVTRSRDGRDSTDLERKMGNRMEV